MKTRPGVKIEPADSGKSETVTEEELSSIFQEVSEENSRQQQAPTGVVETATPEEIKEACFNGQAGDAALFVKKHRNVYLFDHASGRWYKYTGYWQEDPAEHVHDGIEGLVKTYREEALRQKRHLSEATSEGETERAAAIEKYQKALNQKIQLLHTSGHRESVFKLVRAGSGGLGISGVEWDNNTMLLPCKNGIVDLADGSCRVPTPGAFLRKHAPYEWNGIDRLAPVWEAALNAMFPIDPADPTKGADMELVGYLQRLLGYAITGCRKEHVLPVLFGIGRNGKGTITETLNLVLGDLSGPVQAEMLLEQTFTKSSGGPTSDIIALMGRRFAWASETDRSRKLNSSKVKVLCGGDTLVGRPPYGKKEISFPPTHTLFLLTNHKPEADADDYALWQRVHLVPFTVSFVDDPDKPFERKKDKDLLQKLQTEASGILAWLVRGCLEWQRIGLQPPERVREATKAYRRAEDVVGQFIEDRCTLSSTVQAKAGHLFEAFSDWCKHAGLKVVDQKRFSERLSARFGAPRKTATGRFYKGLKLNQE